MKYSVCHDSRIGCRSMNQDRMDWVQTPAAVLLVVADGMGGHRLGDVAAQVAVEQITQAFRQTATPRLDNPQQFLTESVTTAHRAINDYAAQRAIPLDDAPRTTCVACVIQDGHALWVHVGDSRLYHLRWGRTLTHTRDHSRVQMLVDAGQISEREALTHPQRNLVFNCLGGDTPPHIELSRPTPLAPGDILALCTDGAWAPTGDRFSSAFALPIERAVPFLLDAAEEAAGASCDNLTLLVLRWDSAEAQDEAVADDPATQPLSTINTIIQNFADAAILTEADIERSVAEIRETILSQRSNGATQ